MAGGSGERFWPKSRKKSPKQLLPITGKKTMIQLTVERLAGFIEAQNILIITNSLQKPLMEKQLPLVSSENIIAEPVGRDTAACIGLAATLIQEKDSDACMIVLPADHIIEDKENFQKNIMDCLSVVRDKGCLMTIGIKPAFPATGYGYLNVKEKLDIQVDTSFFKVSKFKEKPDLKLACEYVQSGDFFWNSGMFIWKVETIMNELKRQMPDLYEGLIVIGEMSKSKGLTEALELGFRTLPKKSIDYGIMENAENVILAESSFDWDDVGSWEAIEKHFSADKDGNVCIGNASLIGCKNVLVYNLANDDSLIASAIDLEDMILVQTDDAVMVCPKSSSQKVKQIVERLKVENMTEFL